jgi:thiosulfate/3-mercaptopyruvate sulfurtransferase
MEYKSIVSTSQLAHNLQDPDWVVMDCRFDLAQPRRGRAAYLVSHIPGAQYADLDVDLSGPVVSGLTGRHPLPDPESFAHRLSEWGIDHRTQVVVYDDAAGLYAGRLWWMLRWMGHDMVALLDGDWRAWQIEGRPLEAGQTSRPPRNFIASLQPQLAVDAEALVASLGEPSLLLLDARAADRYRGENETLDPVAGHIPGAISAHFAANLAPDGTFLSPDDLRTRYQGLLDGASPTTCVVYCGSGVSAAHNLVAMEIAGLPGARLYPGSWSHWITDSSRPIAVGEGT